MRSTSPYFLAAGSTALRWTSTVELYAFTHATEKWIAVGWTTTGFAAGGTIHGRTIAGS